MNDLKSRVADLRAKKRLTQRQLALAVGVDQRTISHIEKGIRKPSINLAIRLAKEFDISLDELLGRDEVMEMA